MTIPLIWSRSHNNFPSAIILFTVSFELKSDRVIIFSNRDFDPLFWSKSNISVISENNFTDELRIVIGQIKISCSGKNTCSS